MQAERSAAGSPLLLVADRPPVGTGLILFPRAGALPAAWAGPVPGGGLEPGDAAALLAGGPARARCCPSTVRAGSAGRACPGTGWTRAATPAAGRDWSPLFQPVRSEHRRAAGPGSRPRTPTAGLRLVTEVEAVPGGAIRARHTLTNTGRQPYVVDSLEVVFPLPGRVGEVLDFTGRQTAERIPQRHRLGDGLWLREGRRGHTGHDSATVVVAGVPGFGFGHGEVFGVHVAWSGNTVHRVERVPSGLGMAHGRAGRARGSGCCRALTTIGGGELLLPGEITPGPRASPTPRPGSTSRPARPGWTTWPPSSTATCAPSPRIRAPRARSTSTSGKRSTSGTTSARWRRWPTPPPASAWNGTSWTTAGSPAAAATGPGWATGGSTRTVWPGGLHRLVDYVRDRGMQFGLWIEPEMVNPDSDLYRAHPDWILSAGQRVPPLQRHQLVLDLTRPEVSAYLFEQDQQPALGIPGLLRQMGLQPGPHRRGQRLRGTVPRPRTTRRWPSTRCSTGSGSGTRPSSGNRARQAAAGSTWPCWAGSSGSGPPT